MRALFPMWVSLTQYGLLGRSAGPQEFFFNYFENSDAWAEILPPLDEFARLVKARRGCDLLLIHTQRVDLGWFHPWTPVYEKVAESAEERGLRVMNSFDYFKWRRARRLWVHEFDVHPNPEGHRIMADALETGLRSLPAHCWSL